jgi:hypothetical protein
MIHFVVYFFLKVEVELTVPHPKTIKLCIGNSPVESESSVGNTCGPAHLIFDKYVHSIG